ncbi:MAG: DUF4266 domain-containing protein [Oceanococcaceae bacterium]
MSGIINQRSGTGCRGPLGVVLIAMLSGCTITPVQPWERGELAHPDMQWEAGLVDEAAIREHTYTSKEAASLSPTLGGGGCGCN